MISMLSMTSPDKTSGSASSKEKGRISMNSKGERSDAIDDPLPATTDAAAKLFR